MLVMLPFLVPAQINLSGKVTDRNTQESLPGAHIRLLGNFNATVSDKNGTFIESNDDIVIRIPLEDLRRSKQVLVIGGGEKKIYSIRGTLKTGLVTHLITDDRTARALLDIA